MQASLFALALVALAAPGAHSGTAGAAPTARAARAPDYPALLQEYQAALDAHEQRLEEAERAERRALRRNHPAAAFWSRFEALAQGGEGRALLWMATHVREKGIALTSELRPEKQRLYGELFERHVAADWFGMVLDELPREERFLERALLARFYERTIADSPLPAVRAQAMFQLGVQLLASADDESRSAGERWLKRTLEEFAGTPFAERARAELEKPTLGRPVPDFRGETIDGESVRLSEQRGKVVLLNFYGFW